MLSLPFDINKWYYTLTAIAVVPAAVFCTLKAVYYHDVAMKDAFNWADYGKNNEYDIGLRFFVERSFLNVLVI